MNHALQIKAPAINDKKSALGSFHADIREFTFLGIPHLLFRPEDYQGRDLKEAQKELSLILENFCIKNNISGRYSLGHITELAETLTQSSAQRSTASAIPLRRDPKWAHQYDPDLYKEPQASIIIAPHTGNHRSDFDTFHRNLISKDKYQGLPGDIQKRALWEVFHEAMHGTGAAEKAADKAASIFFKRKFGDNALLKLQSDIRAVNTVSDSNVLYISPKRIFEVSKTYTWAMCEAIDEVIKTPREELLSLTDDQIKELRFDAENPNERAANNVGFFLMSENKSYPKLINKITKETTFGQLKTGSNRSVAERFILACKRLNAADVAYTNTDDPHDITPEAEKLAPSPSIMMIKGFTNTLLEKVRSIDLTI